MVEDFDCIVKLVISRFKRLLGQRHNKKLLIYITPNKTKGEKPYVAVKEVKGWHGTKAGGTMARGTTKSMQKKVGKTMELRKSVPKIVRKLVMLPPKANCHLIKIQTFYLRGRRTVLC